MPAATPASSSPQSWQTPKAWRWRIFASTWLCYAGFYFCRKPFFITKSAVGEALAFDAEALSWIGTTYLAAYTVGQFMAAGIGQRIGARTMLLGGMALSIVSCAAFGLVESLLAFSVLMVGLGLSQATGWSGTVGSMAQWFKRNERGTVMGFWATCYQVGGVAAAGLGAWLLARYGYAAAFYGGAAVLAAVFLFFLGNHANKPEDLGFEAIVTDEDEAVAAADAAEAGTDSDEATGSEQEGDPKWSRNTWTTVLLVGAFYFSIKFIRYALWSWAPFFLSRNFGLDGDDAGYISTIFDFMGIGGVVIAGFLSDRFFNGRRARISFYLMVALLGSCFALATIGTSSVTVFAVCMGAIGFCLYGPDALMSGAGAMDVGSKRGAIMAAGIINGVGSIGSVAQELIIGKLYASGGGDLSQILYVLLGTAAIGTATLSVILVRNRMGLSDA
ncbi:MAG: MFS transporter [Myxococcales bacterium]|nr:MFS transporter [Myxococcales bacterium]